MTCVYAEAHNHPGIKMIVSFHALSDIGRKKRA